MDSILKFESLGSINELVQREDYEEALTAIFTLVHGLFWDESLKFKYIHIPQLDEIVQNIGEVLYKSGKPAALKKAGSGSVNLIIASELYETGGHTRVLEDILAAASKPTIVLLTDVFGRYASGQLSLGSVFQKLGGASVLVLPKMGMVDKIKNIYRLVAGLPVSTVGILAHHQDVIAYSACNEMVNLPQIYIHHADHNPTLGATVKHYFHMDLSLGNQMNCEKAGVQNTIYLPLVAKKRFRPYKGDVEITTATSGTFNKFTTFGDLSLAQIVKTILKCTTRSHFHIGPIPSDYLDIINAELIDNGIDPKRFKYLGSVNSLGQTLVENDVNVYVTSAPVPGAKAYVEALGCGIAIVRFTKFREGLSALNVHEEFSYSAADPIWENLDDLKCALSNINLSEQSEKSKSYFIHNHDPVHFENLVKRYF